MKDPIVLDAHGKHAQCVLFSKQHNLLVSAGMDAKVHLWSIRSFKRTASIEGHTNSVNTLSLTSEENLLATGAEGAMSIWDVSTWTENRRIELPAKGVLLTALSPDGEKIYVSIDNLIAGYTLRGGNPLLEIPLSIKGVYGLVLSPDGSLLANASADGNIRIWEILLHEGYCHHGVHARHWLWSGSGISQAQLRSHDQRPVTKQRACSTRKVTKRIS